MSRYLCLGEFDQQEGILNSKCIFCKIIFGNLPSNIIVQDEKAIAFLDAFPLTKGHTLVIPKMHFSKVQNMTEEYGSALFRLMLALLDPIEKAAHVSSSTIAIHNGKEAGQEVDHVHVHIIPRRVDDGAGPIHSMFMKRPQISSTDMNEMALAISEQLLSR